MVLGFAIGYMQRTHGDTRTQGPHWDPAGNVPFRSLVREVHAWINVTSGNITPPQQAAALQRGLGGLAREIAMRVPATVTAYGVDVNGQHTDAVTYIMFPSVLSSRT